MIKYATICLLMFSFFLGGQTKEEIQKRAKESGLSETQFRQLAKQRGLTDQQIEAEISKRGIRKGQESPTEEKGEVQEIAPLLIKDVSVELPEAVEGEQLVEDVELLEEELELEKKPQPPRETLDYFGYSIFKRDPALFQASAFGAIDPDYNIGPGDEIIVLVWGETQFRQEFTVDREGFIFIPDVGQVFVNGLTLSVLESKLKKLLSRVHVTLNPQDGKRPTTFMDVTLGNLRPLRILVLGEVAQPGAYTVSSSVTLFSSLYYFNGPTTLGSLRDIRLIRGGEQIASVDFYDYLLTGKKVNDVRLQLDDVIFIPTRGKTISIMGEIKRPAIYELREGEGLRDLLDICGDINITAYLERIQIDRVVDFDRRKAIGMDRMYIDVNLQELLNSDSNIELQDGDQIQIFSVLEMRQNAVEISGGVVRPGIYDVGNSIRLNELIEKAGGVIGDAYLGQAHIVRLRPDLTEELIRIDLGQALELDPDHNIALQPFDRVQIFNVNTVFNLLKPVWISGAVKNPGRYAFYDELTIKDLILNAGGLSEAVYRYKLEIARVDPHNPSPDRYVQVVSLNMDDYYTISDMREGLNGNDEFVLQPYDVVFVRPDPYFILQKQVTVTGAVLYPGTYAILSSEEKVTDIVNRAGGLRPEAYPEASQFVRSGRTVNLSFEEIIKNPGSKLNFPVLNGDRIIIATRPNLITILGEVNAPGLYKFIPGTNIRDYISLAGGYTPDSNKGNVWIEYPGGQSKKLKRFLPAPGVKDGSTIVIGREEETEPIDKTELFKEVASILASLATTIFVILSL